MSDNFRVRFAANNFSSKIKTTSSAVSGFPSSNVANGSRAQCWVPEGNFTIGPTNNKIYVTDVGEREVTIPDGNYTGQSLALQLSSSLSFSWAASYDALTKKFSLSRPGVTVTLRYSVTTNAIWDTLGYTSTTDHTAMDYTFVAHEGRLHTSDFLIWDFGVPVPVTFFAMLGPKDETFSMTPGTDLKLYGDNVNAWTSPAYSKTLTPTSAGLMFFNEMETPPTYRYWKLEFKDKTNPTNFPIGIIYLGNYITLSVRNVGSGFSKQVVDPSTRVETDAGVEFFDKKPKYLEINNLSAQFINASDREALEAFFYSHGKTESFFLALDPLLKISRDIYENTKFVRFAVPPNVTHIKTDWYSISFKVREAL